MSGNSEHYPFRGMIPGSLDRSRHSSSRVELHSLDHSDAQFDLVDGPLKPLRAQVSLHLHLPGGDNRQWDWVVGGGGLVIVFKPPSKTDFF